MKINTSFNEFKKIHSKKKHQILFKSKNCKEYYKVENLFKFLLAEKNSFIFESVEKGKIKEQGTHIELLNKNGYLIFVLPKSFNNSLYYNKTRQYINDNYTIIILERIALFLVFDKGNAIR